MQYIYKLGKWFYITPGHDDKWSKYLYEKCHGIYEHVYVKDIRPEVTLRHLVCLFVGIY